MTDLLQHFAEGTVPAGLAFINKKDVVFLLVTCLFNYMGDGLGERQVSVLWQPL